MARGDAERAILVLERGAETAERWEVIDNVRANLLVLGVAYAMAGTGG